MKRRGRAAAAALGVLAALAVARPWTVRPIATAPAERFDARTYVDSVWLRVLAEAAAAVDLATALRRGAAASSPERGPRVRTPVFVAGSGVVSGVDLGSRVGLLRLRIEEVPSVEVALQVGPVLRGTALRDALDFVSFTDFANQSEFAAVANALNDRVLRSVLGAIDPESLSGKRVSFSGAALLGGSPDAPLEVVPVTLEIGEEAG
jgi:predicted lipoprotein